MNKLFSVIVLLYNNDEYLFQCLDSIISQDYCEIEIIVVDDGSKSFCKEKIEKYFKDNTSSNIIRTVVYQNEKNLGTVKSINGALRKATGEYIKIIAADDALYDKYSLSSAVKALMHSEDGIIATEVIKCNAELVPIRIIRKKLQYSLNNISPKECFKRLCVHNDIVAGGVFFSIKFFEKYGCFDEKYRLLEDWPMWLRATRAGCKIMYEPFISVKYRADGGIGTSINTDYLNDKRTVLKDIIIPSKGELGFFGYYMSRLAFCFINSMLIRKLYACLFR